MAINLKEKYQNSSYEREFTEWSQKAEWIGLKNENKDLNLKTGDTIQFLNGYDVQMISKILGFNSDGKAFVLWDCYWFPVDLSNRLVKVINN